MIKWIKVKAKAVKKAILRGIYNGAYWIYKKPWGWIFLLVSETIEDSFWDVVEKLRVAAE